MVPHDIREHSSHALRLSGLAGGGGTNESLDVFFFPYPLLFIIHGTEAPDCWLFSLLALGVSFSSASLSWRNDAHVDGAVLRSAIVGSNLLACAADVLMRTSFRKALAADGTCLSNRCSRTCTRGRGLPRAG